MSMNELLYLHSPAFLPLKKPCKEHASIMGNFVGAETSQPSTRDTNIVEQELTIKDEGALDNTEDVQCQEQTIEALMSMASGSCDEMWLDSALMSHVTQNKDLLKPQLYAILEKLHSKVTSSSEDPSGQKKAFRCLTVLGTTFPRRTLKFLVKKMDEVWKDTVLVFHTINILKAVVHSNGLSAERDSHTGLETLDYRQGLLTKLLVIAGVRRTSEICVAALELLSLVDSMIHENILDLWLGRITSLLQYLERGLDNLEHKEWENMLLLFLEDTVFQISNELWVNYFVQSLISQLSCCSPHEKNFIYRCWGVAMKASMGTLIEPSLWRIVQEVRFDETKEREGLAYGLGICSLHHREEVIAILEEYQNYVDQLSTKYYFMEGGEVPITKEQMRTVLLLSYYFVAFLAPTEVILPIMPGIFSSILQNYPHCLRDPLVKLAFTDSVILMCQATMENDAECSLKSRKLMMTYLKDILLETSKCCLEIENCQKATKAITRLVSMNRQKPPEDEATQTDLSMMENSQQVEKPSTELVVVAAAALGSKDTLALSDNTGDTAASQIPGLNDAGYFSNYQALEDDDNLEVICLCISSIMKFPPWDILEHTQYFAGSFIPQVSWDSLELREDIADSSILRTQICYRKTFEAVYEVIRTLIEWHMDPDTLNSILKALKNWLVSHQAHQRERATRAAAQAFQIYRSRTPQMQQSIKNVGHMTGLLLPRCVENQPALHHWGMAAIACLLNGQCQQKTEMTAVESIRILDCEKKCVPTVTIFKTAMLIINFLPADELMQFLRTTLEGMLQNESWSEAIADILKMVLYHRAVELQNRVEILVYIMYDILDSSNTVTVKRAVRSIVGVLAHMEPKRFVTVLLSFPWLVMSEIRTLWRSLIANKTLFSKLLSALLSKVPEKDQERNSATEKPSYLPNTVASVLWEFVAVVKRGELLEEKKEALFYYCFLSIPGASTKHLMDNISEVYKHSSFLSVPDTRTPQPMDSFEGYRSSSFFSLPGTSTQKSMDIIKGYRTVSPCSVAVQALQNILKLGGCEHHVLLGMDEDHGWELMVDDQEQHKGFAALGRVMRNCCPGIFPRNVVQDFLPSLYFHKEACWIDTVAFFAEFVGSPHVAKDEQKMMLDVYNVMKLFIYNRNPIIIMYGMRGISNAIHTMPKKVKRYKENILGIFLRSLSNPWDPNVKQEAISGISKILPYFSSIQSSTSIQLAQQAQNCFDDENPFVRQKALEIFGQQSRYFYWRNDTFCELVEKHLAHVLIHLQDVDPEVAKTTEDTLWKCAPFIRYKPVRNLILNFLHKEDHKITNSFLMEVSRLLVQDCPGRLNKTLSTRAAAACELMGHLMKQEEEEENKKD